MKDENKLVITIGRQFGSGGCEVGTKLAQELGLDFYDKNILRMNSDESGIEEIFYYLADWKAGNKLLYKIIKSLTPEKGAPSFGSDLISADNLFRFQSEVIRKLAAEENCIIMGRCADYVLEGMEGLVRIFIYADMDFREKRTIEKEYYAAKDAKKISRGSTEKDGIISATILEKNGNPLIIMIWWSTLQLLGSMAQ